MMSIANLKRRLDEKISVFSDSTHIQTKFVKPQRLMKRLSILEHKFGDLENVQPLEEKIIKTLFSELVRKDDTVKANASEIFVYICVNHVKNPKNSPKKI